MDVDDVVSTRGGAAAAACMPSRACFCSSGGRGWHGALVHLRYARSMCRKSKQAYHAIL
jgi:hypothetical protein